MKVKELIELLETFNPEYKVTVSDFSGYAELQSNMIQKYDNLENIEIDLTTLGQEPTNEAN